MKRVFDVALAVTGLIFLAPVFCLISLIVLIFNGRPIIFKQVRVGIGGSDFDIFKFRTMTLSPDSSEGSFDVGQSLRVTGIGKFLRRTKLDELPQLWNVLRGDMSLVGPRPEVRKWVQEYPEDWAYIHKVRPGITDPASIVFRNEEAILAAVDNPISYYREEVLPRKIYIYKDYVSNHSFWGDVLIIVKTLSAIIAK